MEVIHAAVFKNGEAAMAEKIKKRGDKDALERTRRVTFALFTAPGLLLYSIFFIYPVALGVYYSMTDWNGITRNKNFIGLQNYISLFTYTRYKNAMAFTLKYSVLLLIATMVLSVAIALLLNKKLRGKTFFRGMYFLPAVLCGITISLVFSQIFMRVLPSIGTALGNEFLSKSLLGRKETAMYGILLVHIWRGLAMPTVLVLAGLQTVPEELYEAAMLDGANSVQKFVSITLPFLIPTLTIISLLTLKDGLGVFDYIAGLTSGGPANSTISVSYLIWNDAFARSRFSLAVAEAIVLSLILIVFSLIQTNISNKRKVY